MDARINTADDRSTSDKNVANFSPVNHPLSFADAFAPSELCHASSSGQFASPRTK